MLVPALFAMVELALQRSLRALAVSLLVGAHCLLRTGELNKLKVGHIQYDAYLTSAVLNLGSTKGSLRRGAQETVSLDLPWLVCLLRALTTPLGDEDFVAPWGTTFRRHFDKLAKDAGLGSCAFKPYSLRRGGATEL